MSPFLQRLAAGLALLVACALPTPAAPDYPAFTGLVVDAAHVLSPWDDAEITRKLQDLEQKTGVQFAVATVPSLGGQEIEPYANGLFRKWKIGQKGANNGLLLILAPTERKLRFEVGYGLEGTMTDAQSKLILRNNMVPKLKAGDPAGALKAGVADAIEVLTKDKADLPERLKAPKPQEMGAGTVVFITLFISAFVLIMILSIRQNGRRGRNWSSGWTWGAPGGFVAGSSSSSGGFSDSGSSSGGDSFSGGGGGDSGGGGSSDSY